MIDMKQLLADRKAGTQGPMRVGKTIPELVCDSKGEIIAQVFTDRNAPLHTDTANARRFARVDELEQALIDAREALAECADYFEDRADTIDGIAPNRAGTLWAICKKGLGE